MGTASGHYVACASLAATALCGNTQFKLDFVETHAGIGVASNFAIRNSVAYTNDHGYRQLWLAIDVMQEL